jgi:hypothetical protein
MLRDACLLGPQLSLERDGVAHVSDDVGIRPGERPDQVCARDDADQSVAPQDGQPVDTAPQHQLGRSRQRVIPVNVRAREVIAVHTTWRP